MIAAYVVAAVVLIPLLAPVAINDDWIYARSAEILVREHRLQILDIAAANSVGQVAWGALFASAFGMSFGVLRLSTVVLFLLSGIALYGLCRELELPRPLAALGAAAYLFSPLAFVLGATFMTDSHFTSLLVISAFLYARGLHRHAPPYIVAGSAFAAWAFLVRQHGLLIPLAVMSFIAISRRLRLDRGSVALSGMVCALPLMTATGFYLWLRLVHGTPDTQSSFVNDISDAGLTGGWLLVRRLAYIDLMYLGLFALPVAILFLVRLRPLWRRVPPFGWAVMVAWETIIVVGLSFFSPDGRRMPYIPHFFGADGLGSVDLLDSRRLMAPLSVFSVLTGVCAVTSLLFALAIVGAARHSKRRGRGVAGLIVALAAWQLVGSVVPSFHFRDWKLNALSTPSLDRYLLPMLPFVLCLGLWALRDVRPRLALAWATVGALAVFSVAGTRDALVMQDSVWALGRDANRMGIPNTRLDAGAAWDGYYLWEYSASRGIAPQTPNPVWWTFLWGPATDSTYVVSGQPVAGFDVIRRVEFSQWLRPRPVYLYLSHRQGAPKAKL